MSDRTPRPDALELDLSEMSISEVYRDPPPAFDGDGEFDDRDVVDMIEEERCPRSPDGTHTYIERCHCNYCGMAAPWVRRDACRSS